MIQTSFICDRSFPLDEVRSLLASLLSVAETDVFVFEPQCGESGSYPSPVQCNYDALKGAFRSELLLMIDDHIAPVWDERAFVRRFSDAAHATCALSEDESPVRICFEPGQPARFIIETCLGDDDDALGFKPYVPGPFEG